MGYNDLTAKYVHNYCNEFTVYFYCIVYNYKFCMTDNDFIVLDSTTVYGF